MDDTFLRQQQGPPQLTAKNCATTIKHINTTLAAALKTSNTIYGHLETYLKLFTAHPWSLPNPKLDAASLPSTSQTTFPFAINLPAVHAKVLVNRFENISDTYFALTSNLKTNIDQIVGVYEVLTQFIRSTSADSLITLPQLNPVLPVLLQLQQHLQLLLSVLQSELVQIEKFNKFIVQYGTVPSSDNNQQQHQQQFQLDDINTNIIQQLENDFLPTHSDLILMVQDLRDDLLKLLFTGFEGGV